MSNQHEIGASHLRLKRVKVFGFKTFADRTDFDLDGDLIAVVGPNGCGKSNLVDAILWGLGEPNARHLRAATSQDIIFGGSAGRKALGFAEVKLFFDNEDGALAIEAPEVCISRKVSRGGDSDYQINGRNCRLKDIYDLLADSGLGKAGYAIVGQREIDAALAASPEDRRGWIDEAAGVQRYRAKRNESVRRLNQATEHLSRIAAIIEEIELQRGPLREEAEVARKYKEAASELRKVESGLLIVEVAGAQHKLAELDTRISNSKRAEESALKELAKNEKAATEVGGSISDLEREMDQVREAQQTALTQSERAHANLQLAEQKLLGFDDLESNLAEEREAGIARRQEAERDAELAAAQERLEADALEALRTGLGSKSKGLKNLSEELKTVERELEAGRESESLRLKSELEVAQRKQREREIKQELLGIERTKSEMDAALAEAESSFNEAQKALDVVVSAEGEATTNHEQAQQLLGEIAADLHRLLGERASLEGRCRGLEATIEMHEGLAQGSRAVLELVAAKRLPDRYSALAESLDVRPEHSVAIEVALGQSASDLIVPTADDAKAAIELLKAERLGRATFQPLDLVEPRDRPRGAEQLLKRPGVVGFADDLVRCDPKHQMVVRSLLSGVLVLKTLDDCIRIANQPGWAKLVSLDGEIIHGSGAVTGGASKTARSGIIQRRSELAELEKTLKEVSKKVAQLESRQAEAYATLESEKRALEEVRPKKEAARGTRDETESWFKNLKLELATSQREFERLNAELEALRAAQSTQFETVDLAAIETRRDDLLRELAMQSADSDQAASRLAEAEQRHKDAKLRHEEARRRLKHLVGEQDQRGRKIDSLDQHRANARQQIEHQSKTFERYKKEAEAAHAELTTLQNRRQALLEQNFRLADSLKELRQQAADAAQLLSKCEIERARTETSRAQSAERLLDEYGISPEDALSLAPQQELGPDSAAVVGRLRREIKAMGEVNLGAIEAYERLSERFGDLANQQEDIVKGNAEIEEAIGKLDALVEDRFLGTFERVRDAFSERFQQLFGGGEGVLRLTDAENLLDSGVEVEVTVPGKKKQRLELLSGGERALAASAFLFALLSVKPSPLVVLDEVDAPLDGRNVERFIDAIRSFSGQIQFLLITHNPVTIEAAPIWFGITMQEAGVSTVIPYKVAAPTAVPHSGNGKVRPEAHVSVH